MCRCSWIQCYEIAWKIASVHCAGRSDLCCSDQRSKGDDVSYDTIAISMGDELGIEEKHDMSC